MFHVERNFDCTPQKLFITSLSLIQLLQTKSINISKELCVPISFINHYPRGQNHETKKEGHRV